MFYKPHVWGITKGTEHRKVVNQVWWLTPEIPALERLRQEDLELRPAWEREEREEKCRNSHL
jgi:hypothetical protein